MQINVIFMLKLLLNTSQLYISMHLITEILIIMRIFKLVILLSYFLKV